MARSLGKRCRRLAWVCCAWWLAACGGAEQAPPAPTGDGNDGASTACEQKEGLSLGLDEEEAPDVTCPKQDIVLCYGRWAAKCSAKGKLVSLENCRENDQICAPRTCDDGACGGCLDCLPNSTRCGDGGERYQCKQDGSGYELVETCDEAAGERCSVSTNECENLCARAARDASYVGCEYWAVPTANSQLALTEVDDAGLCQPFPFAVVIANSEGVPAEVRIESPGAVVRSVVVKPAEAKTVELPCSLPLRGSPIEPLLSALVQDAAHHITSNVPVTVYQFNPLEFQATLADGAKIFSYTNDASLLLPVHSLTGNYRVISRATLLNQLQPWDESLPSERASSPGFVAIVGVEDEPTEVQITSSAYTRVGFAAPFGSDDDAGVPMDEVPALEPGQTRTVVLARGQVLQLVTEAPDSCDPGTEEGTPDGTLQYCKVPKSYDLTATEIHAKGRVQVLAGHDCAFVPYDRWACDHLEETMFPLEAWGKRVLMTISATTNCSTAPNLFRVLADRDDTRVAFAPPEVHDPVTLSAGEYVELETNQAFEVSANNAILVAQYLLGQDYEGRGSSGSFYQGDPSLSLGIPVEQWRNRYSFLIPETYTDNFVNVIAQKDQVVLLDQGLVAGYTPIEGTVYQVSRVRVGPGSHVIQSDAVFGFVVYGFGSYTSYMLPGGLDLRQINGPD